MAVAAALDHSLFKMSQGETDEEDYLKQEEERHAGYVARLLAKEEKWNVFEHEYRHKVQEYQAEIDKRQEWIRAVEQPDKELATWIAQRPASLQKVDARMMVLYCVGKIRSSCPRVTRCLNAREIPWTLKSVWTAILWDHRRDSQRTRLTRLREAIENKDMSQVSTLVQELVDWEYQRDSRHEKLARVNNVIIDMSNANERFVTEKDVQEASTLAQELGFVQLAKLLPLLYRQLNEFLAIHPPRSR